MNSYRVLIVGAGKIAERHLKAWKEIVGKGLTVADLDGEKAENLAKEYNIDFTEISEHFISEEKHDIVDVCVPTPSHAEYVITALEAGKHVFVEKPLCNTVAEAEKILATAMQTQYHVQIGYLFRYHPLFIQVKNWLTEQLIGVPHLVLVRMGGKGSAAGWKHRRDQGGGAINEMLVHKLDLLMWFLGELTLKRVHLCKTLLPKRLINGEECPADAEDFVLVELSAGETMVLLQSDLVSPSYVENVEMHGTNGSILASIQESSPNYLYLKESKRGLEAGFHHRQHAPVNLFEAELSAFVLGLSASPNYRPLEEAVAQIRLLEEIRSRK